MGQKDITEKNLETYNDVFADIVNVLLFDGRQVVKEEELETADPRSAYKAEGKLHELERDVSKYWRRQTIRIAFLGIENQSRPHGYMPLRVIGYDGTSYRAQLLDVDEKGRPKGIYPVVTLVLYFGRKRWDQPQTLYEILEIPEEIKPYVNDYKINLFEISYLTEEQAGKFESDFGVVVDYFIQSRRDKDYVPTSKTVKHVHEVLQMLNALTGDLRFEEAAKALKGDERTMAEAMLDRIEERGMKRGIEQGIEQGIVQGIEQGEEMILKLVNTLIEEKRFEDIQRAQEDRTYRKKLLEEFGLNQ